MGQCRNPVANEEFKNQDSNGLCCFIQRRPWTPDLIFPYLQEEKEEFMYLKKI